MRTTTNFAVSATVFIALASGCGASSSGGVSAGPTVSPPHSVNPSPSLSPSPRATPTPGVIPGADRELSSVILNTAEVSQAGIAVTGGIYRGGTSVTGQKTLDECGASYPSESKRVARIQAGYAAISDPHGSQVASNEVVRYSQGGAAQAYAEIKRALKTCPAHFDDGGKAVGSDTTIEPTDAKLTHDQVTATQLVTIGKQKIWSSITFLYDGDLFSGVYVFRPTRSAALAAGHLLAAISTKKLAAAVASEGTLV